MSVDQSEGEHSDGKFSQVFDSLVYLYDRQEAMMKKLDSLADASK